MGGILEQVRRVIEIECLPADIPKFIDVDVTDLKIGDSIHVQEIQIEKAKILADSNFTIATVVPPAAEDAPGGIARQEPSFEAGFCEGGARTAA